MPVKRVAFGRCALARRSGMPILYLTAFLVHACLAGADIKVVSEKPSLPSLMPCVEGEVGINPYRNIRILTCFDNVKLERMMAFFGESLGVKCTFCHDKKAYWLDDRPEKDRDRIMIRMVLYVDGSFFKRDRVTCYTCHAKSPVPANLPEGLREIPPLVSTETPGAPRTGSYKNVQRLAFLIPAQLASLMSFFDASVGAKTCFACHDSRDFASDGLPKKVRARQMIGMVQEVIERFFRGDRLTCFTCHRGNPFPKQLPDNWNSEESHPTEFTP